MDFDNITGPDASEVQDRTLAYELDEILREFARHLFGSKSDETAKTWVSAIQVHLFWLQYPFDAEPDDDDETDDEGESDDGDEMPLTLDEAESEEVMSPWEVSSAETKDYLKWLANTDYALSTKKNYWGAVQAFYSWADEYDYQDDITANQSRDDVNFTQGSLEEDRRRTVEDDAIDWIKPEKVRQLWDEEVLPRPRLRNELTFKILWFTGMRCRALADLRVDDVLIDDGEMVIPNLKRDDEDPMYRKVVYPREKLNPLLREWINNGRSNLGPYHKESDYLLLSHQSAHTTPSYISRLVKETAQDAGINEITGYDVNGQPQWLVTGHTIRRSAAVYWANECDAVSVQHIASQLGHKDLDTTQKYYLDDNLQARHNAFSGAWGTV